MPETQKQRLGPEGAVPSHDPRPRRASDMGRAVDLSPVSLERALALGRIQAAYQPIVALFNSFAQWNLSCTIRACGAATRVASR